MPSETVFQQIQSQAVRALSRSRVNRTNLYLQREVLPRSSMVRARHQTIPIDRDTIMVFSDEDPLANWAHDCRYLLFDAGSATLYREVPARFPPSLLDASSKLRVFHQPVVVQPAERKIFPLLPKLKIPRPVPIGRRYAILFSGASNNRHVNDMEFLYRTLVGHFHFRKEDIFVLNYDGTLNYNGGPKPVASWPGDGTAYQMTVNGAGTKAAFESVINNLKTRLGSEDLLLIHTNNHGGHDGTSSYLCTYSGPDYTAPDFAAKLAELPTYRDLVVMMEQCHSGGFNDLIVERSTAQRTSFAAACTEHRSSIGGADFDPFAMDWISALAGTNAYGAALSSSPDFSGEGKVSAIESFAFADGIHDGYDSPVFSERGEKAGQSSLVQRWKFIFLDWEPLMKQIEKAWEKRPVEEYQVWSSQVLVPRLQQMEAELERANSSRSEVQRRVGEAVDALLAELPKSSRPRVPVLHGDRIAAQPR